MNKVKKTTLRKPLEPIDEDADCKAAFASLLAEYEELEKLKVKEKCPFPADGETLVSLADYNKQVAAYSTRRDEYIKRHAQHVETIDMVRTKIKSLKVRLERVVDDGEWWALFDEIYTEEHKFVEIQKEADAAFEKVAKHAYFRPNS